MTLPPAGRPLAITLDGQKLTGETARALSGAWIAQASNRPSQAELALLDVLGSAWPELKLGAELALVVGEDCVFVGDVTGIERTFGADGAVALRIRAQDRLHRLGKRQTPRLFDDKAPGDIARQIAGDAGLSAEIHNDGPARRRRMQSGQSDFDFLLEVLEPAGLCAFLEADKLHVCNASGRGDVRELKPGDTLISATVSQSADNLRSSAAIAGWDIGNSDRYTARDEAQGTETPRAFSKLGDRWIADRLAESDAELDSLASADLARAAALGHWIAGTAEGDVSLVPGTRVKLADGQDGEAIFTVQSVLHRIEPDSGYVTEFSSVPPRPARQAAPAITLGEVVDVDDPDELSRVRAKLFGEQDLQSDWLPIIVPGAGSGKGMFLFPEVGDKVIVLMPGGDPARGLVIGGVYGSEQPPDFGEDRKAQPRAIGLRTGDGQSFYLAGDKALARIETSGGDKLEMAAGVALKAAGDLKAEAKGDLTISAQGDLTIEAPGRSITIRARSVDFVQG